MYLQYIWGIMKCNFKESSKAPIYLYFKEILQTSSSWNLLKVTPWRNRYYILVHRAARAHNQRCYTWDTKWRKKHKMLCSSRIYLKELPKVSKASHLLSGQFLPCIAPKQSWLRNFQLIIWARASYPTQMKCHLVGWWHDSLVLDQPRMFFSFSECHWNYMSTFSIQRRWNNMGKTFSVVYHPRPG